MPRCYTFGRLSSDITGLTCAGEGGEGYVEGGGVFYVEADGRLDAAAEDLAG